MSYSPCHEKLPGTFKGRKAALACRTSESWQETAPSLQDFVRGLPGVPDNPRHLPLLTAKYTFGLVLPRLSQQNPASSSIVEVTTTTSGIQILTGAGQVIYTDTSVSLPTGRRMVYQDESIWGDSQTAMPRLITVPMYFTQFATRTPLTRNEEMGNLRALTRANRCSCEATGVPHKVQDSAHIIGDTFTARGFAQVLTAGDMLFPLDGNPELMTQEAATVYNWFGVIRAGYDVLQGHVNEEGNYQATSTNNILSLDVGVHRVRDLWPSAQAAGYSTYPR